MEELIRRDEVWGTKAKELYRVRQLRLQYEKTEKGLTKQFKILNGSQNSYANGFKFVMSSRPGVIKYKDIPELKHIDLDMYRDKPIELWKLEYVGE